jgi:hypothetical protein
MFLQEPVFEGGGTPFDFAGALLSSGREEICFDQAALADPDI